MRFLYTELEAGTRKFRLGFTTGTSVQALLVAAAMLAPAREASMQQATPSVVEVFSALVVTVHVSYIVLALTFLFMKQLGRFGIGYLFAMAVFFTMFAARGALIVLTSLPGGEISRMLGVFGELLLLAWLAFAVYQVVRVRQLVAAQPSQERH